MNDYGPVDQGAAGAMRKKIRPVPRMAGTNQPDVALARMRKPKGQRLIPGGAGAPGVGRNPRAEAAKRLMGAKGEK